MRPSISIFRHTSWWHPAHGRGFWLLLLAGGVSCLFALGTQRTLGTHEAFVAVPAQQMLESGDWLVPQFAGKPRLQKPPLAYWLVAGLGSLAGGVDEFVARLPGAVSTWLLALLVGGIAARWWGRRAGVAGVLMQFSAAWVLTYGRRAEPDMLLTLLGMVAWAVFARLLFAGADSDNRLATRRRLWTVLLVVLGAGWLIKFHYTAALFTASLVVFVAWERRWDWLRGVATLPGWLIFAAAVVAWPLLVWWRVPEAAEVWYRETIGRARGALGHDPWWDYLPKLLAMPLPWTLWVILGVWRLWNAARYGDRAARWLLASVAGQLALISLQPSKHPNYILGIMPLLTLAAARPLGTHLAWLWNLRRRLPPPFGAGLLTAAAVALAVAARLAMHRWPHLGQELTVLALIAACGTAAAVALGRAARHRHALLTLWTCWLVLFCLVQALVLPRVDRRRADAEFGRLVRRQVGPRRAVWLYRLNRTPEALDPVAFYVGVPVVRLDGPCELQQRLRHQRDSVAICYRSDVDELRTLAAIERVMTMQIDPFVSLPHPPFVLVWLRRRATGDHWPRADSPSPATDSSGAPTADRWARQPDAGGLR